MNFPWASRSRFSWHGGRDSAIGGIGRAAFSVQYTLTKATPTSGGRMLRRTGMTMPDSTSVSILYGSGNLNDGLGRVSSVSSGTTLAFYYYTGAGVLTGTDLYEPGALGRQAGTSVGDYPDWDRFNRITTSDWQLAPNTAPVDVYDLDIAYDRASNITSTIDNLKVDTNGKHRFDVLYTLDGKTGGVSLVVPALHVDGARGGELHLRCGDLVPHAPAAQQSTVEG